MAVYIDWGTTSLRAYVFDSKGELKDTHTSREGVMQAPSGTLFDVLNRIIDGTEGPVVMCGMIGSRMGLLEVPYTYAPCDVTKLAKGCVSFQDSRLGVGRTVTIVPGVAMASPGADVMRGEETQILGIQSSSQTTETTLLVMPGTHSKWATCQGSKILGFRSHMTGEVYSALVENTILGKLMPENAREEPVVKETFLRGVVKARDERGGVLSHIFAARAEVLFLNIEAGHAASYLSGILIGSEIKEGAPLASHPKP